MPVLVYQPRRKRFAPKTRTGCVNCKARHLKCGEERPICRRCDISRLQCSYKVPKTWLFDPNEEPADGSNDTSTSSSNEGERRRRSASSRNSSRSAGDNNNEKRSSSSTNEKSRKVSSTLSHTDTYHPTKAAWLGPKLFRSQHEQDSFHSWVTFLVRYVEPRARFPAHCPSPGQDVWAISIPQIAYHSVAVREAMIACGVLVLSVSRKESQAQYDHAMSVVLQHATRAIRDLTATPNRPLIEVVLTAYTFWSLDTMSCKFQSATLHSFSAMRIAQQCPEQLAADDLASLFIQSMICNLPNLEDAAPPPEWWALPPDLRRLKAVARLEGEYDRVTACLERVALSPGGARAGVAAGTSSPKHDILAILEESRQEIQWILSRYNSPEMYEKWLLSTREQSPHQQQEGRRAAKSSFWEFETNTRPGFFQLLVKAVDAYIASGAAKNPFPDDSSTPERVASSTNKSPSSSPSPSHIPIPNPEFATIPLAFPVDAWRKDAAQETLMFMVMVAGTNLALRHITMDFFEVSRKIRWPGRCLI